jgi:5S rRNA maturation endonuclease (ribonuclease M5)
VMAVGRYETGGNKTYRQFHFDNTNVVEGMPPSPYPLFGLPSLKNPAPLHAVVICEGEKCATALHQLGWPAVTSALGAKSTEQTDWLPLRYYKRFIILRDNDKSGVEFARSVSAELYRMQPNIDIQVVNLSPDRNGGDVVDWLQSTVLCGQKWDGFTTIPESLISAARTALCERINDLMVKVEDCPHIAFKPIEALFEGPPKDFDVKLRDVLPFPIHVLPGTVREYLEFISAQVSQTTDFAATAFIAAICGLIGRSTHLKMRPFDEWYETANCWAILVGRPSTKKSPILRRTLDLFKELEVRAASQFASASKKYKAEKRQAEIDEADFDEPEPKRRRYTTDDVTMPKLRELMAANPNGIILRNDELKGQLERLEKIGSEGDRSFMMSCWSGLEVYSEDRMCRDSHINIPLALTWIGCIPPAPLQRYLREAMGRGSGADGFMQRFQFI